VGSPPKDGPNALVQGYMWASRAMTIAMQAVVPAALGYWLDRWWGTAPWLVILGTVLGFACMLMDLIRLTQPPSRNDNPTRPAPPET
jgi:ATP synthase protein I